MKFSYIFLFLISFTVFAETSSATGLTTGTGSNSNSSQGAGLDTMMRDCALIYKDQPGICNALAPLVNIQKQRASNDQKDPMEQFLMMFLMMQLFKSNDSTPQTLPMPQLGNI